MSSGLTKQGLANGRDFHIGLEMGWHKLTRIAQPTKEHFPIIREVPIPVSCVIPDWQGNEELLFNGGKMVIPCSSIDGLPVAQSYNAGTYTLFQPRQAWDYVSACLAGTDYNIDSIGMLWNGSFWFLSALLKELNAIKNPEIQMRFNFSGGLDKANSPQGELSVTRPVCWNTISISRLMGAVLFKSKLTKNFGIRLEQAQTEIEKAVGMAAVFNATVDTLKGKTCGKDEARAVYAGFLADGDTLTTNAKNRADVMVNLFEKGLGNNGQNRWDTVNGLTQRFSNDSWNTDAKRQLDDRQKFNLFESSEFGEFAERKASFVRLATDDDDWGRTVERGEKLLVDYAKAN